ncbi:hypothetical protein HDK77DRAFT_5770 [Phyllosticta capitalensis]|uniref:Secreted protein n=1 Tax=Phyllosticta capitalensis TaxID=121624 RepID=A0ABR1YY33_9PEZI
MTTQWGLLMLQNVVRSGTSLFLRWYRLPFPFLYLSASVSSSPVDIASLPGEKVHTHPSTLPQTEMPCKCVAERSWEPESVPSFACLYLST